MSDGMTARVRRQGREVVVVVEMNVDTAEFYAVELTTLAKRDVGVRADVRELFRVVDEARRPVEADDE